jgi:outer membrane protein assembly factor BamB
MSTPTVTEVLLSGSAAGSTGGAAGAQVPTKLVIFGTNGGTLRAIKAADGTYQWEYAIGGQIVAKPLIVDGKVYIGGTTGRFLALTATDGTWVWEYNVPTSGDGNQVWSSAAFADGKVFFGSNNRKVYAFSAADGTWLWEFETSNGIMSSPAVSDGVVFIGSKDQHVYALSAEAGSKQWDFHTGGEVLSSPTVVDGVVFVGSNDKKLYALNAEDGEKRWEYATAASSEFRSTVAVADGVVFVKPDDGVYAIEIPIPPTPVPTPLPDLEDMAAHRCQNCEPPTCDPNTLCVSDTNHCVNWCRTLESCYGVAIKDEQEIRGGEVVRKIQCILLSDQCKEWGSDTKMVEGFYLLSKDEILRREKEPEGDVKLDYCASADRKASDKRLLLELDDADFDFGDTSAFETDVLREGMDAPVAET